MANWIEKAVDFVVAHNEFMVQTMLVLVVLWCAFMLGTWLFAKPSLGGREETSAGIPAEVTAGQVIDAAVATEAANQVAKLQAELSARTQEIEALKAKSSDTPAAPPVDVSGYEKQIKELEAKLAEYEILEDDIADLSLYKDENARLKAELQKLSGGASVEASTSAASSGGPQDIMASAGGTTAGASEPASTGQAASADSLGATGPGTGADAAVAAAGAAVSSEDSGASFAEEALAAVSGSSAPGETDNALAAATADRALAPPEAQAEGTTQSAPAAQAEADQTDVQPAPVQQADAASPSAVGDVFTPDPSATEKSEAIVKEFATAVEKNKKPEPVSDGDDLLTEFAASISGTTDSETETGLDTDKMMAELASLENVEGDGTSALEGESDIEKMAAEANKLLGS